MIKRILIVLMAFLPLFFSIHNAHAAPFFFADALTWQIRESNASNWAQKLSPSAPQETIQFFEVPFKYSPGIRVGMGFQNKTSPWDVTLYYTGYKTQGTNETHTDHAELHSPFSSNFYANNPAGNGISGPYYHHAAIQWDLGFHAFDLRFSHAIRGDTPLILRPFIGLKAARINQMITSQWETPFEPTTQANPNPTPIVNFSAATETISNRFKGIGPSFGLDSAWTLLDARGYTLDLIANASGAFLSSSWAFSDKYNNNTPQVISTQSDRLSSSALMTQAFLGLSWRGMNTPAPWSVHVGYDVQAWFNQLQYYSFDMGKTNDTLYLQGAVIGLTINF